MEVFQKPISLYGINNSNSSIVKSEGSTFFLAKIRRKRGQSMDKWMNE